MTSGFGKMFENKNLEIAYPPAPRTNIFGLF